MMTSFTPDLPIPLLGMMFALFGATLVLSACGQQVREEPTEYRAAKVHLLDAELFETEVTTQSGASTPALSQYSDCVAAQYAAIRGVDFLRNVSRAQRGTLQGAKEAAIYTLSQEKPRGTAVLVASQTLQACRAAKIPTL